MLCCVLNIDHVGHNFTVQSLMEQWQLRTQIGLIESDLAHLVYSSKIKM